MLAGSRFQTVYKSTQFESDTIWHLEPVQLSSHNFGDRRTIWDLQNESGGGTEDGLYYSHCNFNM